MKFVSFMAAGRASWGLVRGESVVDLGRRLADRHPTLREAIADLDARGIADAAAAGGEDAGLLSGLRLLPPIPRPDKIICIGLNYRDHAREAGAKIPEVPSLFARFTNTLVPHGGAIVRPRVSSKLDFEGELALVIGKGGRHIAEADAFEHVFGYTCFNDGSVRDFQQQHSITAGKNFPATGGCGPWIVSTDEIPDPSRLTLATRVNGREVQRKGLDDMIFGVPAIIAYVSQWTILQPGDVISTGTPEGVGFARKPPLWLAPGDVVEVEISGIGVLRNPVAAED
jgi:2-keto-4-pentenoate hydratase/2-oxohepta-3-ene-1,7-dioic acid hydratase in catechol pathway